MLSCSNRLLLPPKEHSFLYRNIVALVFRFSVFFSRTDKPDKPRSFWVPTATYVTREVTLDQTIKLLLNWNPCIFLIWVNLRVDLMYKIKPWFFNYLWGNLGKMCLCKLNTNWSCMEFHGIKKISCWGNCGRKNTSSQLKWHRIL